MWSSERERWILPGPAGRAERRWLDSEAKPELGQACGKWYGKVGWDSVGWELVTALGDCLFLCSQEVWRSRASVGLGGCVHSVS